MRARREERARVVVTYHDATGLCGSFETLSPGYRVSNAHCAQVGGEALALRQFEIDMSLPHRPSAL
jgi:hypothetical protein